MKKLVMALVFSTDHAFNIEDERWNAWQNWLSRDGRRIIDDTLEKVFKDNTVTAIGDRCVETNILLLGGGQIREINRDCRGKDAPTNVLSFPQFDTLDDLQSALIQSRNRHDLQHETTVLLGDIVLSYDTIAFEAEAASKAVRDHLAHMLVHSMLHLLGHDHQLDHEAQDMETLEYDILKAFGIQNPYKTPQSMA